MGLDAAEEVKAIADNVAYQIGPKIHYGAQPNKGTIGADPGREGPVVSVEEVNPQLIDDQKLLKA